MSQGFDTFVDDLREFKRDREGVLIRGENPILIVSFGRAPPISGAPKKSIKKKSVNNYMIDGVHKIPVNYKAIIKCGRDEFAFLVREGNGGPEFQAVSMPGNASPEDFVELQWNSDINCLWKEMCKLQPLLDTYHNKIWEFVGITSNIVQNEINRTEPRSSLDLDSSVILRCKDGVHPSDDEICEYLGMGCGDKNANWICSDFSKHPIPDDIEQYIASGMVYWVHIKSGESSWRHPFYSRYRRLIEEAKKEAPLDTWKGILSFQIKFFFRETVNGLISTGKICKTSDVPVEPKYIEELGRIFRIDLRVEPYLVHVLKHLYYHYRDIYTETGNITNVEDFRILIKRTKDLFRGYYESYEISLKQTNEICECVECLSVGISQPAVLYCETCKDVLCQKCFNGIHAKGRRIEHKRIPISFDKCAECENSLAKLFCVACKDYFCYYCFTDFHIKGGRRNHIPVAVRTFSSKQHELPSSASNPNVSFRDVTEVSNALVAAMSHWHVYSDSDGFRYFYNLNTSEKARDPPLAPINTPFVVGIGGEFSSSWLGNGISI